MKCPQKFTQKNFWGHFNYFVYDSFGLSLR